MNELDTQNLNRRVRDLELKIGDFERSGRNQLKSPLDSDSQRIIQKTIIHPVTVFLPGTSAATSGNYTHFFIADQGYLILAVEEVHGTAGSDGSAVTLQLEKLTGTTAPGSGTSLLASAFDLKGTANTVQYGNLSGVAGANTLIRGDRLALKRSGTLTAVDSLVVTVYLQKL